MRHPRIPLAWKVTAVFLGFGILIFFLSSLILSSAFAARFFPGREGRILLFVVGILVGLVLSVHMAFVFGHRLSRPVTALAAWAANRRSQGLPPRDLSRGDEFGDLARALYSMSKEIDAETRELEDRAHALEAMNRIDKAVLRSGTRAVLLDQVMDAVIDYAPSRAIGIVVRDPDGGGFDVVAGRRMRLEMFLDSASREDCPQDLPASSSPSGSSGSSSSSSPKPAFEALPLGFLPDAAFPESLLVRYSDSFEVGLGELGVEVLAHFGLAAGDPRTEGLRLACLPFSAEGRYSGSLILVREAGGPGLSRLSLLADQTGVALKDLETREEGRQNWLAVVRSLVRAVDAKSTWTKGHSDRVATLSTAVGRRLLMEGGELDLLEISAILHDVGKIGIPESVLDKPGRLTEEEMAVIRRHSRVGAEIVEDLPAYAGVRSSILYHHERWDGSGYPEGLRGEEIPLGARIIAISDVYDAITDDRPYRKGMKADEAQRFIAEGAGSLFDPHLVRIFLEMLRSGPSGGGDDRARLVAADSP
jgi:hypothetical protein